MKNRTIASVLCALIATAVSGGGEESRTSGGAAHDPRTSAMETQTRDELLNAPIEDFQVELLRLAFQAASALPADPHIKNRSRAQATVVDACLELGQAELSLGFLDRIRNWRSGLGMAQLALFCAQNGHVSAAQKYLEKAELVAEVVGLEDEQGWRAARIRTKIDEAWAALTRAGRHGLDGDQERLETTDALPQPGEMADLDRVIETGEFEQAAGALEEYARLYGRVFADRELREQVEGKLRESWKVLPIERLIGLQSQLAETALENGDQVAALAWVDECRKHINGNDWLPEDLTRFQARAAALRCLAGDEAGARVELASSVANYEAKREKIYDVFRPDALIPVAEAYVQLFDFEQALKFYRLALAEVWSNPNSRPRAECLTRVCRSMALHGIQPDSKLWNELTSKVQSLKAPW